MSDPIYNSPTSPIGLVRNFVWWACQGCPNQQYVTLECGAHVPVFMADKLSDESLKLIIDDCCKFWKKAAPIIQSAKGRCNWNPAVDTDEHHVGQCGGIFFLSRNGTTWFLDEWPEPERSQFIALASEFNPMFLLEENGKLEYHEGVPEK